MKEITVKNRFWKKVKTNALIAGYSLIIKVLTMYFCLIDRDTPAWVRTTIVGALAYFVSPVDAIPDFIAGVGYSDDASVIAAAFVSIYTHIKPEHREKANKQIEVIFGKTTTTEVIA